MAISITWGTRVIYVPQSYLTPLGGSAYELDLDQFRLDLKDLEDSPEGMPFPDTHRHNTEVILSGVTYARIFEIINGYTVTFEDGQYSVSAVGANSNIADVMNLNQVSLRTANSAGLIVTVQGSGVTDQDKLDIADAVWDEVQSGHTDSGSFGEYVDSKISDIPTGTPPTAGDIADAVWDELLADHEVANTFGQAMADLLKLTGYKVTKSGDVITIYEANGVTIWRQYNLADGGRVEV